MSLNMKLTRWHAQALCAMSQSQSGQRLFDWVRGSGNFSPIVGAVVSINRHIGAKLKQLREERGVDPEKLARILSISLERYSAFELGRTTISARHLYDLCDYFDVRVTLFFEGYERPNIRSRTITRRPRKKKSTRTQEC